MIFGREDGIGNDGSLLDMALTVLCVVGYGRNGVDNQIRVCLHMQ